MKFEVGDQIKIVRNLTEKGCKLRGKKGMIEGVVTKRKRNGGPRLYSVRLERCAGLWILDEADLDFESKKREPFRIIGAI